MSDPNFDTPPGDEVLQEDDVDRGLAVPVDIPGIVRTDEMPTQLGALRNILLPAGGQAVNILPEDSRRKRALLWVYYAGSAPADSLIGAMIGRDLSEISSGFTGPILWSMNAITVYPFSFRDALWAKGVNVENTGAVQDAIVASTNDVLLSVVTEEWAR